MEESRLRNTSQLQLYFFFQNNKLFFSKHTSFDSHFLHIIFFFCFSCIFFTCSKYSGTYRAFIQNIQSGVQHFFFKEGRKSRTEVQTEEKESLVIISLEIHVVIQRRYSIGNMMMSKYFRYIIRIDFLHFFLFSISKIEVFCIGNHVLLFRSERFSFFQMMSKVFI